MLTLLPLSGLQAALKRRNSKTMDFSRRDSISVYATYSLPTSKSSLRRFSSYEELAPIFQQLLADEAKGSQRAESPLVDAASTAITTASDLKPIKPKTLSLRRGSVSFGMGKSKAPPATAKSTSEDLDAQLAAIRTKLAEFKNEDLDLSQRVDDLSSSVEELCQSGLASSSEPALPSRLGLGLAEFRRHSIAATGNPTLGGKVWRRTGSSKPTFSSRSSLEAVPEASKGLEEEEDESFENYCKRTMPKIGKRHSNPKVEPLLFPELDTMPDPKMHCILNNQLAPVAKSVPQLNIVRNDLTRHDRSFKRSQRLSVLSCHSDSVIFTHRAPPPQSPLLIKHSLEV